jgi:hypothetical protein
MGTPHFLHPKSQRRDTIYFDVKITYIFHRLQVIDLENHP